ncbi:MAG TPA: IPT/TIG domain-containing protein [Candidatus Xenobia bacterium]|nr:IPT/TIG domain-containing protein [Candidatus Xenobia bacterium]
MAELSNKRPKIERLSPAAAIAGGDVRIHGQNFTHHNHRRPRVCFGETEAPVTVAADDFLVATVPPGATGDSLRVLTSGDEAGPVTVQLGVLLADNLHPVANPAVNPDGSIYVTFSGRRGEKVPISVYKIESSGAVKPFLTGLVNATGLAVDSNGTLFVSSRHEGVVYQVGPSGRKSPYVEGMGVATGLAFDADDNLYVGDRSGTVFKVGRDRQIFVYATLEPSVSAYHLAFGPDRCLYATGPTTSSHDSIYRINDAGQVDIYYRGLGRPQGLAFDAEGNLYVAARLKGRFGVVRFAGMKPEPELVISGPEIVGLAFAPGPPPGLALATTSALYHLPWPTAGLRFS